MNGTTIMYYWINGVLLQNFVGNSVLLYHGHFETLSPGLLNEFGRLILWYII